MKQTIAVIFRRFCAVAVLVVFIQEARCVCRSDVECKKFGETCCRNHCRPYGKCKSQGHCIDNYDCPSMDKICVKKRCVKQNNTERSLIPCRINQDCLKSDFSSSRGFNICCYGWCQNSCSLFELTEKSYLSSEPCFGRECTSTTTDMKTNFTIATTLVPSRHKNRDTFSASQGELNLNPAIIAAIVIAGCIVLTITCVCFLREKRLMRKHSTRCHRHRSAQSSNSHINQPFWISRLARNSTQTRLSCGSPDEEATASFTQANMSGGECCCHNPPSYSTLTIHECPPSYEEATRSHRNQGTQVDLFV